MPRKVLPYPEASPEGKKSISVSISEDLHTAMTKLSDAGFTQDEVVDVALRRYLSQKPESVVSELSKLRAKEMELKAVEGLKEVLASPEKEE